MYTMTLFRLLIGIFCLQKIHSCTRSSDANQARPKEMVDPKRLPTQARCPGQAQLVVEEHSGHDEAHRPHSNASTRAATLAQPERSSDRIQRNHGRRASIVTRLARPKKDVPVAPTLDPLQEARVVFAPFSNPSPHA